MSPNSQGSGALRPSCRAPWDVKGNTRKILISKGFQALGGWVRWQKEAPTGRMVELRPSMAEEADDFREPVQAYVEAPRTLQVPGKPSSRLLHPEVAQNEKKAQILGHWLSRWLWGAVEVAVSTSVLAQRSGRAPVVVHDLPAQLPTRAPNLESACTHYIPCTTQGLRLLTPPKRGRRGQGPKFGAQTSNL